MLYVDFVLRPARTLLHIDEIIQAAEDRLDSGSDLLADGALPGAPEIDGRLQEQVYLGGAMAIRKYREHRHVLVTSPELTSPVVRKLGKLDRGTRAIAEIFECSDGALEVFSVGIQHQIHVRSEADIAVGYHGEPSDDQISDLPFVQGMDDCDYAAGLHLGRLYRKADCGRVFPGRGCCGVGEAGGLRDTVPTDLLNYASAPPRCTPGAVRRRVVLGRGCNLGLFPKTARRIPPCGRPPAGAVGRWAKPGDCAIPFRFVS